MKANSLYLRPLRRLKWGILGLTAVCAAAVEAHHYFIQGVTLTHSVLDWLTAMAITVVLVEITFRAAANLQRRLQRDIAQYQRAQRALRQSEERFRAIFETAQDSIFIKDRSLRYIQVNPAMERLFAMPASELIGRTDKDLFGPEAGAHIKEVDSRVLSGQTIEQEESNPVHGIPVTFHVIKVPMFDSTGQIIGLCGIARDITERKRTEQALKRSEAFLNMTGRMAKVGGWELDAETKEVRWTEETYRIHEMPLGYKPPLDEAINFYHPEDRPKLEHAIQRAIDHGEPYDMEIRFVTAAGKHLWTHTICTPHVVDGKTVRLTGTFQDITERKRAEEEKEKLEAQLRQAQKMEAIGQLAGGVAHDFNNILTTILGNTEMLLDMIGQARPADANASAVPALEQIQTAGQRAAALTRQLLTFSRKHIATPAILDPNRIVAGMENMLRRLVGEHIHLKTMPASDLQGIRADPAQIEQAIMNLVLNARDAMPDGGKVTIQTANAVLDETYAAAHVGASAGRHVMIAVADTGAGMDAETLTHIFEPFFTTKPVGQGTGLGLASVYGIVRQAGGHVSVDSRPGHGTTVKVFLPAVDAPATPPETKTASTRPGGHETILVCEDEETIRQLACHFLKDAGYHVIAAENGARALQVAAEIQGPIHVLLTDVIMPEMNGQEVAAVLTARYPKMKTLFVSGYTSDVIAPLVLGDKSLEFLQKPFKPTDLLQRVRQLLDKAAE